MHKNNDELLSVTDAATRIGVNRSTLFRQIATGAVRSHEGKVRLSEVLADRAANIDLTRSRRRAGDIDQLSGAPSHATPVASEVPADATAPPDATDDEDDATPVMVDGKPMPYAEAKALKESYHAWRAKLAWQVDRGDLASVAEMQAFVERVFGTVRERLLAIPGKLSGTLTREHAELVRIEIYDAMEELSDARNIDIDHEALAASPDQPEGVVEAPAADEFSRVGRPVPARRTKDQRRPG